MRNDEQVKSRRGGAGRNGQCGKRGGSAAARTEMERERALLTHIMLAAEQLCATRCARRPEQPEVELARPPEEPETLAPASHEAVACVAELALRQTRSDAAFAEALGALPGALGNGDTFRTLFDTLFPGPHGRLVPPAEGEKALSAREAEVLRMAAHGLSHRRIAELLGITLKTAEAHLFSAYTKLDAKNAVVAAARAIVRGYLPHDALDPVRIAMAGHGRTVREMESFCGHGGDFERFLPGTGLEPLAQLGLFLLAVSNNAARLIGSYEDQKARRGVVARLDAGGRVVRTFGSDRLGIARAIAVAPPHAAPEGFQTGHLFVVYDNIPQAGLNRGAIAQFTAEGRFVRAFAGSAQLGTHLVGPLSLAFDSRGALLATSGMYADAILAFTDGGRAVERFAEGLYLSVAVGGDGRVYAGRRDNMSEIVMFDPDGRERGTLGDPSRLGNCHAIAAWEDGGLAVVRDDGTACSIEQLSLEGKVVCSTPLAGFAIGKLAAAGRDVLFANPHSHEVMIVRRGSSKARRVRLDCGLIPWAVGPCVDGGMWVCGEQTT